ncbi:hypothetical protein [Paraferrimonas sp. SM1919]|uniref:hypothetical protein n=1 Tax=Paraferrimonas sp. SM1919 TaxID=2662263 RepID=UPI0013D16531|nr:hypothetical protein [Paraferrimonas sp. SM1919]
MSVANKGLSSFLVLILILFNISSAGYIWFLSTELKSANNLLNKPLKRLIMVTPNEQGPALEAWLKKDTDKYYSYLENLEGEVKLHFHITRPTKDLDNKPVLAKTQLLEEDENGVKVFQLPHGGVQITTRDREMR